MTIIINVQLALDEAISFNQRSLSNNPLTEIEEIQREYRVSFEPLHKNTKDIALLRHFIVKVDNRTKAEKLINQLLRIKYVEGAYIKPKDELPSNLF